MKVFVAVSGEEFLGVRASREAAQGLADEYPASGEVKGFDLPDFPLSKEALEWLMAVADDGSAHYQGKDAESAASVLDDLRQMIADA